MTTLTAGDEAAIIAVGVAVILAVTVGIFRVASLRGDMNSKWSKRVAFAVSALNEKTLAELEQLRDAVDEALPATPDGFDPSQAIVDPEPLFKHADNTVKYYKTQTRMKKDVVSLRRLGPIFVATLIGLDIATGLLTAFFAELLDWSWLKPVGLGLLAISVLVLIVTGAMYIVLQNRLANGEILAGTGGQSLEAPER